MEQKNRDNQEGAAFDSTFLVHALAVCLFCNLLPSLPPLLASFTLTNEIVLSVFYVMYIALSTLSFPLCGSALEAS